MAKVVVMDHPLICVAAVAGIAAGIVVVLIDVVGVILVDRPAAIHTGCIVPIIAGLTQWCVSI